MPTTISSDPCANCCGGSSSATGSSSDVPCGTGCTPHWGCNTFLDSLWITIEDLSGCGCLAGTYEMKRSFFGDKVLTDPISACSTTYTFQINCGDSNGLLEVWCDGGGPTTYSLCGSHSPIDLISGPIEVCCGCISVTVTE